MCLSSIATSSYFSYIACFTYDSEADRIALGGYFAARCAAMPTILLLLLLALLKSYIEITILPSSSIRFVYYLTSIIIYHA